MPTPCGPPQHLAALLKDAVEGDEGGLGGHYPLGHLRRGGGSISALGGARGHGAPRTNKASGISAAPQQFGDKSSQGSTASRSRLRVAKIAKPTGSKLVQG